MQHYVINFKGRSDTGEITGVYAYAYFSLPVKKTKTLIPFDLHGISIHEDLIWRIVSKIFDATDHSAAIFRILENVNIREQISEWLISISAEGVYYIDTISIDTRKYKLPKYMQGIGCFELELSSTHPRVQGDS